MKLNHRIVLLGVGVLTSTLFALPANAAIEGAPETVHEYVRAHGTDAWRNAKSTGREVFVPIEVALELEKNSGRTDQAAETARIMHGLSREDSPNYKSADNCSIRVCVHVTGSGLTVRSWWGDTKQYSSDGLLCPWGYLIWNLDGGPRNVWTSGPYGCLAVPPGVVRYMEINATGLPFNFPNNSRLHADFDPSPPLSGYPTVTVHS